MSVNLAYDVFLSHSAKDKSNVRELAERLRSDGLNVWFDEWVLRPSDSISPKTEERLEHSPVLVLYRSANVRLGPGAVGSGHVPVSRPAERGTPLHSLHLDDAPIKGSLAQFLYINWLAN
jgi:hypothetical protein